MHPRRKRRYPGDRRAGQALVETALGLMLFLVLFLSVINMCWLFYHQIVISQAVKKTTRRAGTNRFNRDEIRAYFFRSVGPSLVSSTNGNTTVTITTQAVDPTFASLNATTGKPTVSIDVAYLHPILADLSGALPNMNLRARSRSQVSTWSEAPVISF